MDGRESSDDAGCIFAAFVAPTRLLCSAQDAADAASPARLPPPALRAMASLLSLPRIPLASPTTSAPHHLGLATSRCGDSAASRIGVARTAGLEACCCAGEDRGASGSGSDGIHDGVVWGRREVVGVTVLGAAVLAVVGGGGEALARDRRNKREIDPADYLTSGTGIKYFDVEEGKGAIAQKGETVMVHFDCVYRSITAVSSRESKILAGNRTIAEPYQLNVGAVPGRERKRDFVENANGLFSAQAAPKPPPALYAITEGMRVGGKRTVIVPPELGYGEKGLNEIPPGATFDLNIELLEVKKSEKSS